MKFPYDYPYSPPAAMFIIKMWHPNVYEIGEVCIILHPPVDDPQGGALPSVWWEPAHNVRTILLGIISLLNEPNTSSPANVDASVSYRKWKSSQGFMKEVENIVRKQVELTQADAEKHRVRVPTAVATMFRRMLDCPALATTDLSALRVALSGAAPCAWELAQEWRARETR